MIRIRCMSDRFSHSYGRPLRFSQMRNYYVTVTCEDCGETIIEDVHAPDLVPLMGKDVVWGKQRFVCSKDRTHKLQLNSSYGLIRESTPVSRVRGKAVSAAKGCRQIDTQP